jgi:cytochrome b561
MRSAIARGDRYSSVAIAFHWTIAALVLFNLWLGLAHDNLPREWQVMTVHKSVGLTVLVLSLARLAWRLTHRPPLLAHDLPAWERAAALAAHWGFYALLILMPLSGWVMSSQSRRPLHWFWAFDVPKLPVTEAMGDFAGGAHEWLGWTMIALILLHVAAALRHHLILRDATLARMLPIVRAPE